MTDINYNYQEISKKFPGDFPNLIINTCLKLTKLYKNHKNNNKEDIFNVNLIHVIYPNTIIVKDSENFIFYTSANQKEKSGFNCAQFFK
mgnify:FL=1